MYRTMGTCTYNYINIYIYVMHLFANLVNDIMFSLCVLRSVNEKMKTRVGFLWDDTYLELPVMMTPWYPLWRGSSEAHPL